MVGIATEDTRLPITLHASTGERLNGKAPTSLVTRSNVTAVTSRNQFVI